MPIEPADVVRQVVSRFQSGESVGTLFAPDYQVVGTPASTLPAPRNDPDSRVAAMRTEGLDARVREIVGGSDGRVLVRSVWSHRSRAGGGSAFLVHAVMTVRDGLLVETRYFATGPEAERYAGLPERGDPVTPEGEAAGRGERGASEPDQHVAPADRRRDGVGPRDAHRARAGSGRIDAAA